MSTATIIRLCMMLTCPVFYYGAVPSFDSTKLKLNGAYFKEEYNKRINQVTMGQAKIKKATFLFAGYVAT